MSTKVKTLFLWVVVAIGIFFVTWLFVAMQGGELVPRIPEVHESKAPEDLFSEKTEITAVREEIPHATLIVGESTIELPITSETLYESLKKSDISFEGREHPGLGFFITRIGSLQEGNGAYLMYFINGKEASVGASSYIPKNNDVIEWKLK